MRKNISFFLSFFFIVSFGEVDYVKDDETHYKSFTIDGHTYFIGDSVKLDASDDDNDFEDDNATPVYWYARIVDIFYHENEYNLIENCKYIYIFIK